jgi:regulator of sirC expression with transglutaminase-like and TPR domain
MREPSSRFLALLGGDESAMELDEAAMEVAALDHGDLARQAVFRQLDIWARRVHAVAGEAARGAVLLHAVNHVLFEEEKLQGDREDYYSPANSCIDMVMARRKGLPITLSVICIEVARRAGLPLSGVNLPGHFICRYDDEEGIRVMVDPFNGGRLLTEDDCLRLAQEATGAVLPPVEALFAPAPKSRIIGRMLNNLHGAYWRRGDIDKAVEVAHWLRMAARG